MTMREPISNRGNLRRTHRPRPLTAFTLIEMITVIAVIGILISVLLPTLQRVNDRAKKTKCMSNLRQIGIDMLIYSGDNNGYLFPDKLGWPSSGANPDIVPRTNPPQFNVWPYVVFKVWNPPIMLCPADIEPAGEHSYVINEHLAYWRVRYSTELPNHRPTSEVVLMGEKTSRLPDYYMEYGDYDGLIATYRHGLQYGSNFLFLDMHVDSELPAVAKTAMDPWDFAGGELPATQP